METILKNGYEKIIGIFYSDKHAKIHLRDIARKTNLNENSVSRFLNQLEKLEILKSKKDGNLKKYELKKNDIAYYILSYYDLLRLNKLPNIRKNAILYFLEKLGEKPIIAVLFGSTSKKTYKENSDIDILLVVNKKINTKSAKEYVDAQTAIKISVIQITINEFKEELKLKKDRVIQSAINTGYPITNHIEYYKEIFS